MSADGILPYLVYQSERKSQNKNSIPLSHLIINHLLSAHQVSIRREKCKTAGLLLKEIPTEAEHCYINVRIGMTSPKLTPAGQAQIYWIISAVRIICTVQFNPHALAS